MIREKDTKQGTFEGFGHPFENKLDPANRWVVLANALPWEEMAKSYNKVFENKERGRPALDARLVIGALSIKHHLRLSDIDTIEVIKENPYMQYFLGLSGYTYKAVFDPSLFVAIRKRLGIAEFEDFTHYMILAEKRRKEEAEKSAQEGKEKEGIVTETASNTNTKEEEPITHKGTLIVDASVADADIHYPTDLDLLNDGRQKSEQLIDKLCAKLKIEKPRTYRQIARKEYLNTIKKKRKSKKELRSALRKQLNYLHRNIGYLYTILDSHKDALNLFNKQELKYFYVIQELYRQQKEMYDADSRSCKDRIVSIHQPHVRPIVRGKSKGNVEFGGKIGVATYDGYTRIDKHSWDAYNESSDVPIHLENYRKEHGYYPERFLADQIYLNRENRKLLKEKGIKIIGKSLGRPTEESRSEEAKAILKKAAGERNQVEGRFGTGKRRYGLNNIRAKLSDTSLSWTAACIFVMNMGRFLRELLFVFIFVTLKTQKQLFEKRVLQKIKAVWQFIAISLENRVSILNLKSI